MPPPFPVFFGTKERPKGAQNSCFAVVSYPSTAMGYQLQSGTIQPPSHTAIHFPFFFGMRERPAQPCPSRSSELEGKTDAWVASRRWGGGREAVLLECGASGVLSVRPF